MWDGCLCDIRCFEALWERKERVCSLLWKIMHGSLACDEAPYFSPLSQYAEMSTTRPNLYRAA
jgi:hypothetical protein